MFTDAKNHRPDRLLQKRLVRLAYSLAGLTAALALSFIFPEHLFLLLGATTALTVFSLVLTLLTLKAGEQAISYGGFANEILRVSTQVRRIDNSRGQMVLANDTATDLFGEENVLSFLERQLSRDNRSNAPALRQLQNAFGNLAAEVIA